VVHRIPPPKEQGQGALCWHSQRSRALCWRPLPLSPRLGVPSEPEAAAAEGSTGEGVSEEAEKGTLLAQGAGAEASSEEPGGGVAGEGRKGLEREREGEREKGREGGSGGGGEGRGAWGRPPQGKGRLQDGAVQASAEDGPGEKQTVPSLQEAGRPEEEHNASTGGTEGTEELSGHRGYRGYRGNRGNSGHREYRGYRGYRGEQRGQREQRPQRVQRRLTSQAASKRKAHLHRVYPQRL